MPPSSPESPICFTVDVEDWYQGMELPRGEWDHHERRLEVGLLPLLDLLDEHDAPATFFTLGWVARYHPDLVREISHRGHELASHGFSHDKVYDLTPDSFRHDVRTTKNLLEDVSGQSITAYRAPFFSVTSKCLWALGILAEEGYSVDCSISPVKTWRYGISTCPDEIFRIPECDLVEFPVSSIDVLGRPWGVGGAYFRLLPYAATRSGIRRRQRAGMATMFYIHPWELDAAHPRISMEWKARITHYTRLGVTRRHLARLASDFKFDTVSGFIDRWRKHRDIKELSIELLQD